MPEGQSRPTGALPIAKEGSSGARDRTADDPRAKKLRQTAPPDGDTVAPAPAAGPAAASAVGHPHASAQASASGPASTPARLPTPAPLSARPPAASAGTGGISAARAVRPAGAGPDGPAAAALAALRTAFDAFDDEGEDTALGVAVSGGSDSTALLVVAAELARSTGRRVEAATVDHRLRPEAASEAAAVARLCETLGIRHETLIWQDAPGRGSLQDAARRARFGLLADWARRRGLGAVALAHTMEDQAETVLSRLARGSGVDGLAGMAARDDRAGLMILRPFLGLRREALRALLRARDIAWIEDPSNDDPRFERVRLRRAIAELGLSVPRLAATAEAMARARQALDAHMAQAAARVLRHSQGALVIDRAGLAAQEEEIRLRMLAAGLRWVTAGDYRPRLKTLQRAVDSVREGRAATLAGAILLPQGPRIVLAREGAAAARAAAVVWPGTPNADAGGGPVWDGRWQIAGDLPQGVEIRAIGAAGAALLKPRPDGLPARALHALPGIWQEVELLSIPGHWGLPARARLLGDPRKLGLPPITH